MTFPQLLKDLETAGAEAHETTLTAGMYYDGTQHGILYPGILARIEPHLIGWEEAAARKRAVADVLKKYRTIYAEQIVGAPYIAYAITTKADRARAEAAAAEATIFLEAFHRHRHEALKAGEDDPAGAVKAGQAAIEAWKQIPKYEEVI